MRIVYLSHQYPPEQLGGTEIYTHRLACLMRARGHDVSVVTVSHARERTLFGHDDEVVDDIPVRRLYYDPALSPNPFLYEFYNPCLRRYVEAALAERRPDVVHATHVAYLSGAALLAASAHGAPLVFHATDFWLVCPTIQLVRHDGRLCRGPEPGVCQRCMAADRYAAYFGAMPAEAADDGAPFPEDETRLSALAVDHPAAWRAAASARPAFLRRCFDAVAAAIAPSRFLEELLVDNGYPARRIRVIPHGVDEAEVKGDQISQRLGGTSFRFGFVGALAPRKGAHVLIEAMRSLPDGPGEREATLDLFGSPRADPDYAESLRALARDDRRIRFRGPFGRAAVRSVYAQMDALVMPSLWYENAPLVLREAMVNRLPVIATDLGGMRETLARGGGLLVPRGDAAALAAAMRRLKEEPELAAALVASAPPVPSRASEGDAIEALYREVAGARA